MCIEFEHFHLEPTILFASSTRILSKTKVFNLKLGERTEDRIFEF